MDYDLLFAGVFCYTFGAGAGQLLPIGDLLELSSIFMVLVVLYFVLNDYLEVIL